MNKDGLHHIIVVALESILETAKLAALQAYNTATDSDNVAENKYDTFSLEASYLAAGHSKRVEQYEAELGVFRALRPLNFTHDMGIKMGALVVVENSKLKQQHYFISPVAGGVTVAVESHDIILLTPSSPLGMALIGRMSGDEFDMDMAGQLQHYIILDVL